jgi:TolA-binding protein
VATYPSSPQLAAARYGWAWALSDAGQTKEADAQFQIVHDTFRQSRFWNDATFRLAETSVAAKQFDKARQLLDELSAAKPPQPMVEHMLYLRGELAAAEQQWDRVEAAMSELVRQFPNSTLELPACYWIAEANYRLGKYDESGRQFAAVATRTEGRKDAWLAMVPLRQAQVLGQKKQWLEAQVIAARIETDFPDFAQQYEADYLLGRALAAQADFDGARKRYQKVVRSATGSKTETAAMAQWMIGESYFHQENYDAALREYLRVEILYAYPRWQAAAVLQAGKCEELLGRKKEAAEMYARLIKAYPNTEFTDEGTRRLHALQSAAAGTNRNTSQR